MADDQFVDYIKLRKEDDGWWYDEYSNNHQRVGNSDEGYASKSGALSAAFKKHGMTVKMIDADGDSND